MSRPDWRAGSVGKACTDPCLRAAPKPKECSWLAGGSNVQLCAGALSTCFLVPESIRPSSGCQPSLPFTQSLNKHAAAYSVLSFVLLLGGLGTCFRVS